MTQNNGPSLEWLRESQRAGDRLARLKAMNDEYRNITGSDLYLYATQPGSTELFTFQGGKISGLVKAQTYMEWALDAARRGVCVESIVAAWTDFAKGGKR